MTKFWLILPAAACAGGAMWIDSLPTVAGIDWILVIVLLLAACSLTAFAMRRP